MLLRFLVLVTLSCRRQLTWGPGFMIFKYNVVTCFKFGLWKMCKRIFMLINTNDSTPIGYEETFGVLLNC